MKSLASVIGANKLAIIFGGALIAGAWFLVYEVRSLSSEVTTLSATVTAQTAQINYLKTSYEESNRKSNVYITTTNKNFSELNNRLDRFDKALGREKTVAAKPGLVTKIAKEQVSEYQDRLSCVSGNKQSCLRLQQQSQPAKVPQK